MLHCPNRVKGAALFSLLVLIIAEPYVTCQWSIAHRSRQLRRYNLRQATCAGPPTILNGHYYSVGRRVPFNSRVYFANEAVFYKCATGFRLIGNPLVRCSVYGWSTIPSCDTCSAPSSVDSAISCYDLTAINGTDRCVGPPKIENAFAYVRDDSDNPARIIGNRGALSFSLFSYVRYKCLAMHELVGEDFVICLPGGKWSMLPVCRPMYLSLGYYCTSPPLVDNGIAYMDIGYRETELVQVNPCSALGGTFHVSETIDYACKHGFYSFGRTHMQCYSDNSWPVAPSCRRRRRKRQRGNAHCPMPPRPKVHDYPLIHLARKTISIRTENCPFAAPFFRPGDVLFFNSGCKIRCRHNGKWATATLCKNASRLSSDRKFCLDPPPYVRNSRAYFLDKYNITVELFGDLLTHSPIFETGQAVFYTCKENFVHRDRDTTNVTCLSDGTWSEAPFCKRLTPDERLETPFLICSSNRLPTVDNAEPHWKTGEDFASIKTVQKEEAFELNKIIRYSCYCGYQATAKTEVRCLATGFWSVPQFECVRSNETPEDLSPRCPSAPLLSGGQLFVTMNEIHNETFRITQWTYDFAWSIICDKYVDITYTCNNGYEMQGESRIRCLPSGEWTEHPTCNPLPSPIRYRCTNPPEVTDAEGYYRWLAGSLVFVPIPEETQLSMNSFSGKDSPLQLFELYETVSFTCRRGFTMLGSSITECQHNRTWSVIPICWPSAP